MNKFIFAGIGLIVIIAVALIVWFNLQAPPVPLPILTPTLNPQISSYFNVPTHTQIPTFTPPSPFQPEKVLHILRIAPKEDTTVIHFPVKELAITFEYVMNPKDVLVQVTPEAKTNIRLSPNDSSTILITPDPIWKPGITVITILPTTRSINGALLKEAFSYNLHTNFPQNPPDKESRGL